MAKKIVFAGGPATGKTTLIQTLELRDMHVLKKFPGKLP